MTTSVAYRFSPFALARTGWDPWRDDLVLPRRWEVEVDDGSVPYLVTLSVVMEGGEPIVEGVQLVRRDGTPGLSSRAVRGLRLGEYAQAAANLAAFRAERNPDGSISLEPARTTGTIDVVPEDRMSESHLRAVAAVYNDAVSAGSRSPRRAVMEDPRWRPVPPNTAARWIRAARDVGLLEQVSTRAAERPKKKGAR